MKSIRHEPENLPLVRWENSMLLLRYFTYIQFKPFYSFNDQNKDEIKIHLVTKISQNKPTLKRISGSHANWLRKCFLLHLQNINIVSANVLHLNLNQRCSSGTIQHCICLSFMSTIY